MIENENEECLLVADDNKGVKIINIKNKKVIQLFLYHIDFDLLSNLKNNKDPKLIKAYDIPNVECWKIKLNKKNDVAFIITENNGKLIILDISIFEVYKDFFKDYKLFLLKKFIIKKKSYNKIHFSSKKKSI